MTTNLVLRSTKQTSLSTDENTLCELLNSDRFQPGDHLHVTEIADLLGISATPVREALCAFSSCGVVASIPGRGFFIPHIDPEELAQMVSATISLLMLASVELIRRASAMHDAPSPALQRNDNDAPPLTGAERARRVEACHTDIATRSANTVVANAVHIFNLRTNRLRSQYLASQERFARVAARMKRLRKLLAQTPTHQGDADALFEALSDTVRLALPVHDELRMPPLKLRMSSLYAPRTSH